MPPVYSDQGLGLFINKEIVDVTKKRERIIAINPIRILGLINNLLSFGNRSTKVVLNLFENRKAGVYDGNFQRTVV